MRVTLPLENMSLEEKIDAMEQLWTNLGNNVPSPEWHSSVLARREADVQSGVSRFSPWAEAKERIRKQTTGE